MLNCTLPIPDETILDVPAPYDPSHHHYKALRMPTRSKTSLDITKPLPDKTCLYIPSCAILYQHNAIQNFTGTRLYLSLLYLHATRAYLTLPSPTKTTRSRQNLTYTKIRHTVGYIVIPHHRTTSSFDVTTKRSYASASRYSV